MKHKLYSGTKVHPTVYWFSLFFLRLLICTSLIHLIKVTVRLCLIFELQETYVYSAATGKQRSYFILYQTKRILTTNQLCEGGANDKEYLVANSNICVTIDFFEMSDIKKRLQNKYFILQKTSTRLYKYLNVHHFLLYWISVRTISWRVFLNTRKLIQSRDAEKISCIYHYYIVLCKLKFCKKLTGR